jgi:nucleotide-binding universal stress UspA family protein
MFDHVVVGVRDEEIGRDAIALAKALLAPHGEVTLLHVHVVASRPAPDSGAVTDAAKHRDVLAHLGALAGEFSLDAHLVCVDGQSARRGLHEFASQHRGDLLVVGASHLDDLTRDLVGDDTNEVLVNAPCAVAVAPVGYSGHGGTLTNIGVAYDDSAESARALGVAGELAAAHNAALSVFEAVEPPFYIQHDPWNLQDAEINQHVADVRRRLAALGGLEAGAAFGEAVPVLKRYQASVDLLVIGSHRHRPIDRLSGRTTAQQLADEPSSPLLILPVAAAAGRARPSAPVT